MLDTDVDEQVTERSVIGATTGIARGGSAAGARVFHARLQDISEPTVDRQNAIQRERARALRAGLYAGGRRSTPATLVRMLTTSSGHHLTHDGLMMETAGAQCLLLAGFFEDQMRRRHNIRWYRAVQAFSPGRRRTVLARQGPPADPAIRPL